MIPSNTVYPGYKNYKQLQFGWEMVINGPPQNVMYPSDQDGSITKLRTARSKPLTSYVIFIIEV